MTASTDQGKKVTPASRRPHSKHAGWKTGVMVAGFGAVVLGAGYLAGVNAPAVGAASLQTVNTLPTGNQGPIVRQQQAASDQDNAAANGQASNGQAFQDDDSFNSNGSNGGLTFNDQDNDGRSNSDDSSVLQASPRQFRRFRGNGSGLGQFGQQQPQFGGPMTRSRGS